MLLFHSCNSMIMKEMRKNFKIFNPFTPSIVNTARVVHLIVRENYLTPTVMHSYGHMIDVL